MHDFGKTPRPLARPYPFRRMLVAALVAAVPLLCSVPAGSASAAEPPSVVALQQPAANLADVDEATFVYVSANRIMEFDAASGAMTALAYVSDGVPGQPSRSLGGGAVAWTVRPLFAGPMTTYVGESVSDPGTPTAHSLVADLPSFARLAPDATGLLYVSEEPDPEGGVLNNVRLLDLATETEALLIPLADAVDWSPDGARIAYVSYPTARLDLQGVMLYTYDVGTGQSSAVPVARLVHPGEPNIYSPRWSPGGQRIAFQRLDYQTGTVEVVTTTPAGTTEQVLLTAPLGSVGPGMEWIRLPGGDESLMVERIVDGGAPYYIEELPAGGGPPAVDRVLHGTFSWQAEGSFGDVGSGSTFRREIRDLATLRVVGGFADGSYRPGDPVKRAQYAKMITIGLGLHDSPWTRWSSPTFPDVPRPSSQDEALRYPFDYVEEAAAAGLIRGDNAGRFKPFDSITRVQLALMIARAGSTFLEPAAPSDYLAFSDTTGLSQEARDAIALAYRNGIIKGKTATTFAPYTTATRGQVAAMTWRLMQQLGLILTP